jgi:hypothetical protein
VTRFLALYDGQTISSASLLAVSADERLVRDFGKRLIDEDDDERDRRPSENGNGSTRRPPAKSN